MRRRKALFLSCSRLPRAAQTSPERPKASPDKPKSRQVEPKRRQVEPTRYHGKITIISQFSVGVSEHILTPDVTFDAHFCNTLQHFSRFFENRKNSKNKITCFSLGVRDHILTHFDTRCDPSRSLLHYITAL